MPLSPRTNPGHGSGPPRYPGTFLAAFREAVSLLGWQIKQKQGDMVACLDPDGEERIVGLENLYRRARRTERSQWTGLIREFLEQAIGSNAADMPADLAAVADQLMIRLGQPFSTGTRDASLWSQPLAETGLIANLVIDYPGRMIYVTEQLIAESGRPASEWYDRALVNLLKRTPDDALEEVDADSGLLACGVGDAYDSSRALLLDRLLPGHEENGFFVGLPCRDQLLVLPVSSPALVAVHLLKMLVAKNYKGFPYPISEELFWVRSGVWHRFSIDFDGNKVTIQPPEEFSEVLERLAPDQMDDDDEPEETGEDDGS